MEKLASRFSFRGRVNRQRYWFTLLGLYGALLVASLLAFNLLAVPLVGWPFAFVTLAAGVIAGAALAVRRLHDRNKRGWWLLLMYAPFLALTALGQIASVSDAAAGSGFATLAMPFAIWMFVELGCLDGTRGPNRFGPDPLGREPLRALDTED